MSAKQKIRLTNIAARICDDVMSEVDNPLNQVYSTEEQYHVLRYLTNMLEAEEEKLWKEINK